MESSKNLLETQQLTVSSLSDISATIKILQALSDQNNVSIHLFYPLKQVEILNILKTEIENRSLE